MANQLTRLPRTQFSGLDFNNIMEDLTRLVIDNPDYNENWEDFLSSNAGRMMAEVFAYIADQLATRIDWAVNENFIGTATQKSSIIRILKLIGYNFELPYASEVPVIIALDRPVGEFNLSTPYSSKENGEIDIFSLTAKDKNGRTRNYELINFDEVNRKYEYKVSIDINSGDSSIPILSTSQKFYEGTTYIQDFVSETDNNAIFTLSQSPVIQDSVRVYMVEEKGDTFIESELLKVNSFLDPEAQREENDFGEENEIPFILNVIENDNVSVEFGPTSLLANENRRVTLNSKIRVFYRVGGGVDGNLIKRSINTRKRLLINGEMVNVNFVNNSQGTGGKDAETAEQAVRSAPLLIRTVNKTVTAEDYDIVINNDPTVVKSKSYGNGNVPSDLFDLYGEYIKPLDVWNFIAKSKPGWEDLFPSQYKNFEWLSLRLENRFNEKMSFSDGEFNVLKAINSSTINKTSLIDYDGNGLKEFKNYTVINVNGLDEHVIIDGSINPDLKIKITTEALPDNFFYLIDDENIFKENRASNSGLIEGSTPSLFTYEALNAWFLSLNNITDPVNTSETNNYLSISIDNRDFLDIEMFSGATTIDSATISSNINTAFLDSSSYNNGNSIETKGDQKINFDDAALDTDLIAFDRGATIKFRINGVEYSFVTEEISDNNTISQLIDSMNEAYSLNAKADLVSGVTTISNVLNGDIAKRVKKGWRVSGTYIPSGTVVVSVNRVTGEVVLDNPPSSTLSFSDIKFYPFWAEWVSETPKGILIENLQEDPTGPLWIDVNTNLGEEDLFTNTYFNGTELYTGLDDPTYAGIDGYQEIGINGVVEPTRGFQTFGNIYESSSSSSGVEAIGEDYDFLLDVDGTSNEVVEITTTAGTTVSDIVNDINTALDLIAWTTTTPVASFDTDLGKIKITSGTTGDGSTISITEEGTPAITDIIDILGTPDTAIPGDDGESGITEGTNYCFKINEVEYSFTAGANTTNEQIVAEMNTLFAEPYVASIVPGSTPTYEWAQDIRITNTKGGWVNIEQGTSSTDLFSSLTSIRRLDGLIDTTVPWTSFNEPVGGGSYSHISDILNVPDASGEIQDYLFLQSPSFGELTSRVEFRYIDDNLIFRILGIELNSGDDNIINYGYQKATLVSNEDSDNFGKIIYENGCTKFDVGIKQFYINYLYTSNSELSLGDYRNTEFDEEDPSWRIPATRIYNTVYNQDTGEIDTVNSNFQLKFTKEETESMSLYSIDNDWNMELISPASIESLADFLGDLNTTRYLIEVNIDGVNDVEIDVTGDLGVGGTYTLTGVIDNINSAIRNYTGYDDTVTYGNFTFVKANSAGDGFTLSSPLSNNSSSVEIKEPSGNDATGVIFGLNLQTEYSYTYGPSGDYYLSYHQIEVTGDFTEDSQVIANISLADIEKIDVGMRIPTLSGIMNSCYVIEKDNDNITVNLAAISNSSSQDFYVSNDKMIINKITSSTSNMPDSEFYIHYIFDKRYVEGIYDGATVGNITRPGFALGSLDEDIYEETLNNKKIVSVNNVFKETKFSTFDIRGTIYHKKVFASSDIQQNVENSLRKEFNIENRSYGEKISRSKVMNVIHSVDGVDYIELNFLGKNMANSSTNVGNSIEITFDELIVISEDIFIGGQQTHGINFNYRISEN